MPVQKRSGNLFIEHLIVNIRARHCLDIMIASAIIILQTQGGLH